MYDINIIDRIIIFKFLASPTKKPEIISILKHKNDITLSSQSHIGN